MAERDMHPLLMWWEEERRKVENKTLDRFDAQMTGLESPQRKRLLDVDGLQKTLQGLCQWRVDSVFHRR